MFRSVPLAPVRVNTRPVRAGRRIAVLEVTVEQDDGPVGQGKALLLRRSEQPGGPFRPPPAWDAPPRSSWGRRGRPRPAGWTAPWESWRVGGPASPESGHAVTGGLWIRESTR